MTSQLKNNICKKLLLTHTEYDDLLRTAPARYKVYPIPKKSNSAKTRIICQPAKELKLIQRFIIKEYLDAYPIHDAATAYIKKKSAYKNGEAHADNSYILKIDFKDFFNSIKIEDFMLFLKSRNLHEFSKNDIESLCQFLFWYNYKEKNCVLSIGAPSSPKISNVILYDFDTQIEQFCIGMECVYTRYADDITISSPYHERLKACYDFMVKSLQLSNIKGLAINESKTKFLSKKGRRIVTGFIISNDGKVSLGRDKKRLIRAMAHKALNNHEMSKEDLNYLKGMLGHIKHFDENYFNSLKSTYGEDFFTQILRKRIQ